MPTLRVTKPPPTLFCHASAINVISPVWLKWSWPLGRCVCGGVNLNRIYVSSEGAATLKWNKKEKGRIAMDVVSWSLYNFVNKDKKERCEVRKRNLILTTHPFATSPISRPLAKTSVGCIFTKTRKKETILMYSLSLFLSFFSLRWGVPVGWSQYLNVLAAQRPNSRHFSLLYYDIFCQRDGRVKIPVSGKEGKNRKENKDSKQWMVMGKVVFVKIRATIENVETAMGGIKHMASIHMK